MKKLIAKRPVLYLGRMYDKGDTLPANDQKMVTAWLNARSAAWDGQEAEERRQEAVHSSLALKCTDGKVYDITVAVGGTLTATERT